jgi:hypothetical protein
MSQPASERLPSSSASALTKITGLPCTRRYEGCLRRLVEMPGLPLSRLDMSALICCGVGSASSSAV